MTEDQRRMVSALSRVTFLPATFDKRFAKGLLAMMESDPEKGLTDNQDACLRRIVHKYRRQHNACRCEECKK